MLQNATLLRRILPRWLRWLRIWSRRWPHASIEQESSWSCKLLLYKGHACFVCGVRTAPFLIHWTLLTFLCHDSGTMIATCTAETIGDLTNVLMIMDTLACAGKWTALFSFVIMSIVVMIIETLIYCWLTPPVFVSRPPFTPS
jgi:hypothetical protein